MGVTFLSACTKKSGFWCTILLQAGDPVLHEPAEEVKKEDIGSVHIEKTINDMVATMRNAPGVGLAAPQIGVPLQASPVLWYPYAYIYFVHFINQANPSAVCMPQ